MRKLAKAVPTSLLPAVVVALLLGFTGMPVQAISSQGYTGRTNLSGGVGCAGCHGAAADPNTAVTIAGPTTLMPGVTGTYTITATRAAAGAGVRVGIDVAASDAASLSTVAGEPTVVSNMEVVHTTNPLPLHTTSAGGSATYSFKYTMPANAVIGSTHTLAGVSAVGLTNVSTWNHAPNFTVTTASPLPGSAGTYYVSAATGNDNNLGTQAAPFKTIKKGMAASAAGAIINVLPGTYGNNNEIFPIVMKSGVQLVSTAGAATTVIDASGSGSRVFNCDNGAATTLIQGFTMRGGHAAPAIAGATAMGGAILCTNGDQTTIINNIITSNSCQGSTGTAGPGSSGNGGGIFISASSTIVVNNIIKDNFALGGDGHTVAFNQSGTTTAGGVAYGGGVYVSAGTPLISNNTFNNNTAQGGLGGVNINNTSVGSAGGAASGGAAFMVSGSLVNNIFSNNSAVGGSAGGSSNAGAGASSEGAVNSGSTVDHNLFFANTANANTDGTVGTNAKTGQNPQFASASDFHIGVASPANAAGTPANAPAADFDGHVRGNPPSVGAFDPVVPALGISIIPSSVAEGATVNAAIARNTTTAAPLAVTIGSSDPTAASAQPSTIIPAGQASVLVPINGVADGVADGTQNATITVSASGYASASAFVIVTDVDVPTLTLSIATAPITNPVTFSEASGVGAATGTVSRNTPTTAALTVNLSSSDPARATVPATVLIPAGATFATFPITAVNNSIADGPELLTFTASQTGLASGNATATVTDDDGPALTVSVAPNTFSEGAGANAALGTVSRNTPTTAPLTVTLVSGNTSKATVPPTVIIPAGQISATFPVGAVDDGIVDADQVVSITAGASGLTSGMTTVTVTNNDGATLALSIAPTSFSEAAGLNAATATLTRNSDPSVPLTVNLSSSNTGKATVPPSINFAAGQATVTFPLTAVDNFIADGNSTSTITASAAGFGSGSATATITDNDVPGLSLTISPAIVSEAGGAAAATATVTRNTPTGAPLVVGLVSDTPTRATVQPTVTIPAGAASATFPVAAVNNLVADGPKTVIVSATAPGYTGGTATVQVQDDDAAQLSLSVSVPSISEADGPHAAIGTVTRNTLTTAALSVHLQSNDTTEATVPANVVIPAGQASANFFIGAVNDTVKDGSQQDIIVATASGFRPGFAGITITDNEPSSLNFTLNTGAVNEGAGANAAFGTLTRTGSTTAAVTLTLQSSNNDVVLPATVIIPATKASASFPIQVIADGGAYGPSVAVLTASGTGLPVAQAALLVKDVDVPTLTLSLSQTTFSEGAGAGVVKGTVTRNTSVSSALTITLKSSVPARATVPATVVIPAGSSSATFAITPVDNALVDGPKTVSFTASAPIFPTAVASAVVTDNDGPTLKLTVNLNSFSETAGAHAATATVTRTVVAATPLTVALKSSNTARATVPATVIIPANAASAQFFVGAVNNSVADGPQAVTLTVAAPGFDTGSVGVTVNDDDSHLVMTITPSTFSEAAGPHAATVTLSRQGPLNSTLVVSLKSSDTTEATVPATVTIPYGLHAATCFIAAVNDTLVDGIQHSTITATAPGYPVVSKIVTVTDDDHAGALTAPATSSVALSTATANAATASVQLRFGGALDAESAGDASHYSVTVNGRAVAVASAAYNATTHAITLALAEGALYSGDRVAVSWNGLVDAGGVGLGTGSVGVIAR